MHDIRECVSYHSITLHSPLLFLLPRREPAAISAAIVPTEGVAPAGANGFGGSFASLRLLPAPNYLLVAEVEDDLTKHLKTL